MLVTAKLQGGIGISEPVLNNALFPAELAPPLLSRVLSSVEVNALFLTISMLASDVLDIHLTAVPPGTYFSLFQQLMIIENALQLLELIAVR